MWQCLCGKVPERLFGLKVARDQNAPSKPLVSPFFSCLHSACDPLPAAALVTALMHALTWLLLVCNLVTLLAFNQVIQSEIWLGCLGRH